MQEEFEPCLTSHQVIGIVDTLLNGLNLLTASQHEGLGGGLAAVATSENMIDMNTLVAIMSTSKIPSSSGSDETTSTTAASAVATASTTTTTITDEPQTLSSEETKQTATTTTSGFLIKKLVDSFGKKRPIASSSASSAVYEKQQFLDKNDHQKLVDQIEIILLKNNTTPRGNL